MGGKVQGAAPAAVSTAPYGRVESTVSRFWGVFGWANWMSAFPWLSTKPSIMRGAGQFVAGDLERMITRQKALRFTWLMAWP